MDSNTAKSWRKKTTATCSSTENLLDKIEALSTFSEKIMLIKELKIAIRDAQIPPNNPERLAQIIAAFDCLKMDKSYSIVVILNALKSQWFKIPLNTAMLRTALSFLDLSQETARNYYRDILFELLQNIKFSTAGDQKILRDSLGLLTITLTGKSYITLENYIKEKISSTATSRVSFLAERKIKKEQLRLPSLLELLLIMEDFYRDVDANENTITSSMLRDCKENLTLALQEMGGRGRKKSFAKKIRIKNFVSDSPSAEDISGSPSSSEDMETLHRFSFGSVDSMKEISDFPTIEGDERIYFLNMLRAVENSSDISNFDVPSNLSEAMLKNLADAIIALAIRTDSESMFKLSSFFIYLKRLPQDIINSQTIASGFAKAIISAADIAYSDKYTYLGESRKSIFLLLLNKTTIFSDIISEDIILKKVISKLDNIEAWKAILKFILAKNTLFVEQLAIEKETEAESVEIPETTKGNKSSALFIFFDVLKDINETSCFEKFKILLECILEKGVTLNEIFSTENNTEQRCFFGKMIFLHSAEFSTQLIQNFELILANDPEFLIHFVITASAEIDLNLLSANILSKLSDYIPEFNLEDYQALEQMLKNIKKSLAYKENSSLLISFLDILKLNYLDPLNIQVLHVIIDALYLKIPEHLSYYQAIEKNAYDAVFQKIISDDSSDQKINISTIAQSDSLVRRKPYSLKTYFEEKRIKNETDVYYLKMLLAISVFNSKEPKTTRDCLLCLKQIYDGLQLDTITKGTRIRIYNEMKRQLDEIALKINSLTSEERHLSRELSHSGESPITPPVFRRSSSASSESYSPKTSVANEIPDPPIASVLGKSMQGVTNPGSKTPPPTRRNSKPLEPIVESKEVKQSSPEDKKQDSEIYDGRITRADSGCDIVLV